MKTALYLAGLFVIVMPTIAVPQGTIPGVGDLEKAVGGKVGSLIDLNSATTKQLTSLPGITSALADKIIQARPFKQTNELVSKNILTQSVFDKIKNLITAKVK
jgi:DNA uptake protein ComE-like DNA-binding protein